jgi:hypothetical protein
MKIIKSNKLMKIFKIMESFFIKKDKDIMILKILEMK